MGHFPLLSISAAFCLAGCASAPPSVFRQFDLDKGYSVSTDATQRAIINTRTHPSSRPGRVNPERIVCAEPSPDVASVVANSFAFSGNIFGKGNAAISADQATALAQLAERTVTVQLLRDQMYRACEAYANGAISATDYSLLMSRNNDAMVTLMLGEAASRTVGRDLATLSSEASGSASASMPAIVEAAKEAVAANEASDKADEELAAAKEQEAAADAAVQMTGPTTTQAAADSAQENAEAAEEETAEKEQAADAAKDEAKEKNQELMQAAASGSAKATATKGGGSFGQLNKEAVDIAKELGKLQRAYLDKGAEQHFISACIVELGTTRKAFDYYETSKFEPNLYFTAEELTDHQKIVADAILRSYGIQDYRQYSQFAQYSESYEGKDIESLLLGGVLAEADIQKLSPEQRRNAAARRWANLQEDLAKVYQMGRGTLSNNLQYDLAESIASEGEKPIVKYLANRRKKSDRLWRGLMAVQDRESASLLAQECLLRLPDLLTREHNIHFVNDVLDFVEDVEEERASVLKKQFEASAGSKTDKKTPPPAAAADKMMKAAGELVKCPDGVAGNECRKKNAGAVVASLGGGSTQGGNDNSPRGPRKPDVSELSPLAAYAAAELSFSKLIDAANEFEKNPLGACPESCGKCLAGGGSGGRCSKNGKTPPCSKRCQAIIAQGYDVKESELKAAFDKHQTDYQKSFGFNAKDGLEKNEKKLAETRQALAKEKDPNKKAALLVQTAALEHDLVTARKRYQDLAKAFDKTAGDIATHVRKISELPKD